jgi:hypothetical protein
MDMVSFTHELRLEIFLLPVAETYQDLAKPCLRKPFLS